MDRIRLLIAALDPMLSDIVKNLVAGHPGLELVGEVAAGSDLSAAVAAARPDVLLTREDGSRPGQLSDPLLYIHPRLRVLSFSNDGCATYLQRLVPQRIVIPDVSPADLLAAILGEDRFGPAPLTEAE